MNDPRIPSLIIVITLALLVTGSVFAATSAPATEDILRGAQLYDSWFAVLGIDPPSGNMPIWSRQTTNTRSGGDTWRCSECHGWDYRGAQGEYQAGSHYTGFPDLLSLVAGLQVTDIVDHLNGALDPAHDFSPYLDEKSLVQLADFLKYGIIDDSVYINPVSLHVINPDYAHGKLLYQSTCQACHGEDGKTIVLRVEGIDEYLGSLSNRDPWRFLHRTRFGTAGTDMPAGISLGWLPADGRDILAYAQSLPAGGEIQSQPPLSEQATPPAVLGGPTHNLWTGILTSLGTMVGAGVIAGAFIVGFMLMAFVVVVIFRRRGKRNS